VGPSNPSSAPPSHQNSLDGRSVTVCHCAPPGSGHSPAAASDSPFLFTNGIFIIAGVTKHHFEGRGFVRLSAVSVPCPLCLAPALHPSRSEVSRNMSLTLSAFPFISLSSRGTTLRLLLRICPFGRADSAKHATRTRTMALAP